MLAQFTRAPIIPINFQAKRKWVLNSWDHFIIPKPFSKAVVSIGQPYYVPSKLSKESKEKVRKEIENIMLEQIKNNQKMLKEL